MQLNVCFAIGGQWINVHVVSTTSTWSTPGKLNILLVNRILRTLRNPGVTATNHPDVIQSYGFQAIGPALLIFDE